ncbi:hypothetical protein C4D60_Mb05t27880 [Musa balbisiana]|uniref:Uncharacterized protein n=1 Tax=Musa balbisiana TaxID=52838 RepID=A0A4S8JZG0_MUSBA|nr:hypothetical protein C4D60_Mb05t27880 [Musa balbisiana]
MDPGNRTGNSYGGGEAAAVAQSSPTPAASTSSSVAMIPTDHAEGNTNRAIPGNRRPLLPDPDCLIAAARGKNPGDASSRRVPRETPDSIGVTFQLLDLPQFQLPVQELHLNSRPQPPRIADDGEARFNRTKRFRV